MSTHNEKQSSLAPVQIEASRRKGAPSKASKPAGRTLCHLDSFYDHFFLICHPANEAETRLVQEIARCRFRLDRILTIELALLELKLTAATAALSRMQGERRRRETESENAKVIPISKGTRKLRNLESSRFSFEDLIA